MQKNLQEFKMMSPREAKCEIKVPRIIEETEYYIKYKVPSRSIPDKWYEITYAKKTRLISCECKGFRNRGDCTHIKGSEFQSYKPIRKRKKKTGKTGVQDTSIWSYRALKTRLGALQLRVYDAILENEPVCNNDLVKILRLPISTVTARVYELRNEYDPPLVDDNGRYPVGHGGRIVHTWKARKLPDGQKRILEKNEGESRE